MTKEERIKRYEAIVKWGSDYVHATESFIKDEYMDSLSFDRELLEEYVIGLQELKAQKNV
jgi:hypothetical protein